MSFNAHIHDKLREERRQALLHEMAQRRMLAGLPQRNGVGRRMIGRLGVALVSLGSRLEQFKHRGEPAMHSANR